MLKAEARKKYRQLRAALGFSEKDKYDDLLLIQFQQMQLPFMDAVLSYYPLEDRGEPNTFLLTDYLHFRNPGLRICYPKTNLQDHSMEAIACHPDSIFTANAFNLPEPDHNEIVAPEALDLVFVPMLICDLHGHRVGYGKGFYDRYLQRCRPGCIKVGLSYFDPVNHIEDKGQHDVPLNFCITPHRTYVF